MNDETRSRMRSIRMKIEEESKLIDQMVDVVIAKYNKDLHSFIEECYELLKEKDRLLEDTELENMTIRIPMFMYFAATGLETLGIEGDTAKAHTMEVYNEAFGKASGTIKDKAAESELKVLSEKYIEIVFIRAYKKLKTQIEMAEHIFSGVKKVLSKRMNEMDLTRGDFVPQAKRGRRLDDD